MSFCGFVYDSQGRRCFCLSICGTHAPCRRRFSFCCFSASHGSCRSVANASCDHPSYYSAPPSASSPSTSSPPPPSPSSLSARTSPSAVMLARTCIGNRRQTVWPFFFSLPCRPCTAIRQQGGGREGCKNMCARFSHHIAGNCRKSRGCTTVLQTEQVRQAPSLTRSLFHELRVM